MAARAPPSRSGRFPQCQALVRNDDGPSGDQARVRGCAELTAQARPDHCARIGRDDKGGGTMEFRCTTPWWVVFGAVTGLFVCNGPVLGFTFGVFLKPIMADTGWQRATTSFALSFGGILSAIAVPVLGRMMDRWSIRTVALPGLVVYTLSMCLLGFAPAVLWIFTLMFALAEMTSAVKTPLGYTKAISAWFDRRRGLALGIAMSGVGLGGFVMPQLAERLIEHVGWRGAYVSLGLLTFVIAFPAVASWIREPRHGEGEHGAAAAIAVLPGQTVPEAVSTTRFWMLGAAFPGGGR